MYSSSSEILIMARASSDSTSTKFSLTLLETPFSFSLLLNNSIVVSFKVSRRKFSALTSLRTPKKNVAQSPKIAIAIAAAATQPMRFKRSLITSAANLALSASSFALLASFDAVCDAFTASWELLWASFPILGMELWIATLGPPGNFVAALLINFSISQKPVLLGADPIAFTAETFEVVLVNSIQIRPSSMGIS